MRKSIYTIPILLGAFIFLSCAHAPKKEMKNQKMESQTEMKQNTPEKQTSAFTVNGLKVIVKRTPGNPVVASGFYLNGGTKYVPMSKAGIENFYFHVATHGTKSLTKDSLNTKLESMGTNFSVVNQYDYSGLTMTSLKRNYDESWALFADVLLHPRLAQSEIDLVRQQIQSSIKSEKDDPDSYVRLITNKLYYKGYPYAVSLNGTDESIASITQADLQTYHDKNVTKTRGVIVVVGDVSPEEVKAKVQSIANALPTEPKPNFDVGNFNPGPPAIQVEKRDLPTNYILGFCPAPAPGTADYPAFTAGMRILYDKLFEEIRTKRNLSYAPASGYSRRATNYGYLYITTTKPDTSIKVMFATVKNMADNPLPKQDVKNEITSSITRDLMGQETAQAQMGQLAMYELVGGGWQNASEYLTKLKKLTPNEIQSAVGEYTHDYHFGVVGNPDQIDKALFTSR